MLDLKSVRKVESTESLISVSGIDLLWVVRHPETQQLYLAYQSDFTSDLTEEWVVYLPITCEDLTDLKNKTKTLYELMKQPLARFHVKFYDEGPQFLVVEYLDSVDDLPVGNRPTQDSYLPDPI